MPPWSAGPKSAMSCHEAFRQGIQGAAMDVALLGQPWRFSLREIQPEVHLWQGEADTLVPPR